MPVFPGLIIENTSSRLTARHRLRSFGITKWRSALFVIRHLVPRQGSLMVAEPMAAAIGVGSLSRRDWQHDNDIGVDHRDCRHRAVRHRERHVDPHRRDELDMASSVHAQELQLLVVNRRGAGEDTDRIRRARGEEREMDVKAGFVSGIPRRCACTRRRSATRCRSRFSRSSTQCAARWRSPARARRDIVDRGMVMTAVRSHSRSMFCYRRKPVFRFTSTKTSDLLCVVRPYS